MGGHAKSLAEVKVNIIHYCLSVHKASHLIIKSNGQIYFALGTAALAVSIHPLVLHVPRMASRKIHFIVFLGSEVKLAFKSSLLPFLKMNVILAFFSDIANTCIVCYI